MELSKNYSPAAIEDKWSAHWAEKRYFHSQPDGRKPFTVVIPPPNVTGVLHMGHTLNETVQDILVRRARMSGLNACWVPGSDHASIATEARVVHMLKERGLQKIQLTREEFLQYAWEWKEKYGSIIYSQIRKLGCSVDWDRTTFTMDDHYYGAVIQVFVDLFNKGLIYRGARMVNWDPAAKTALSDEEVEYKDVQGQLYYVKYPLANERGLLPGQYLVVATQRPETIMGDTAVCVNPTDQRYQHLKGLFAIVPLVNRKVPILFDDYVDKEFGTGALKITPAHDLNDYNLGLKHNLPIIDTLNADGTMSEAAQVFVGLDRQEARKKAILQLKAEGLLEKEESYQTRLGFSQRTSAVVEPRISTQWFVRMRALAAPALKEVVEGRITIYPVDRYTATYKYWLENVQDWCISRQLWWGQRIPAWYDGQGNFVVAATEQEARRLYLTKFGLADAVSLILKQDEDVLDTWFSSWIWPLEVFHGITQPGNTELNYYYPTSVLVTGQDIIFFWVARMIMSGMEYKHEKPFAAVYFTGMVRDKQGRKMSKSLGNSPDLLDLIDKYGADAVRFGILISSPAGNDLLFDEASLEQGRNFNNKLWNALKLIKIWEGKTQDSVEESHDHFALIWFENRLREVKAQLEEMFTGFRLSEALKTIYTLIWDDFCSWYLEWVKPEAGQNIDSLVYQTSVSYFDQLLQLLHPFMPFISEEIYHLLQNRQEGDDLCVRQYAPHKKLEGDSVQIADDLKLFITGIREFRQAHELKNSVAIKRLTLPGYIFGQNPSIYSIIQKQGNIAQIIFSGGGTLRSDAEVALVVTKYTFKNHQTEIVTEQAIDTGKIKDDLIRELDYLKGFLVSVDQKLSNEKFVRNAKPDVVALEQKKKSDAESRIKTLEESLMRQP
jgi:valyl-tRNA synthetase